MILGLRLQRYSTNTKRYPQKKFLETLRAVLPAKTTVLQTIGLLWFLREEQYSKFPKTFFGGYLFVVVEYLCKRSPKIKTKNTKNYSSISAIVNHRNWLDDSPPLNMFQKHSFLRFL